MRCDHCWENTHHNCNVPLIPLLLRVISCKISINIDHIFNFPQDIPGINAETLVTFIEEYEEASDHSIPVPSNTTLDVLPFLRTVLASLPDCRPVSFLESLQMRHRQIDLAACHFWSLPCWCYCFRDCAAEHLFTHTIAIAFFSCSLVLYHSSISAAFFLCILSFLRPATPLCHAND